METQISYFAVFGGLDWDIDTTKDLKELIHTLVLKHFDELYEQVEELTLGDKSYKRLLRALAIGDRKIFSAFNRAGLNNGNGGAALNYLQEKGLIEMEYSREVNPRKESPKAKLKRADAKHRISHKVFFTYPFIRFWFYFISPNFKAIQEGNFEKVLEDFEVKHNSYTSLIYEELSELLLNYNLRDAHIISSGSYWDANVEIDILTVTENQRIYVGECKWTNHKINKKELHKLNDKCQKLNIVPTQIALFSKRGFSKELEAMAGADLALYSSEDFTALVKSNPKDTRVKALFS